MQVKPIDVKKFLNKEVVETQKGKLNLTFREAT
jgi:hypothetical protein